MDIPRALVLSPMIDVQSPSIIETSPTTSALVFTTPTGACTGADVELALSVEQRAANDVECGAVEPQVELLGANDVELARSPEPCAANVRLAPPGNEIAIAASTVAFDTNRLLERFLARRTATTRRAYTSDVDDFARSIGASSREAAIARLLAAGPGDANGMVLDYADDLRQRGLSVATSNRRLAALRSCVYLARVLGLVTWAIEIKGAKVRAYRDSRGPGRDGVERLLAATQNLRDRAIVRLLFDLALRRAEVCSLNVEDVDFERGAVAVLGKGRTEREWFTMPTETVDALRAWLAERDGPAAGPLFIALDRGHYGVRLGGNSIWRLVRQLGKRTGDRAWPHGLRHASVTAALLVMNGDVRAVAKFSRHLDVRTVLIYDDQRCDVAGEIAKKVAATVA